MLSCMPDSQGYPLPFSLVEENMHQAKALRKHKNTRSQISLIMVNIYTYNVYYLQWPVIPLLLSTSPRAAFSAWSCTPMYENLIRNNRSSDGNHLFAWIWQMVIETWEGLQIHYNLEVTAHCISHREHVCKYYSFRNCNRRISSLERACQGFIVIWVSDSIAVQGIYVEEKETGIPGCLANRTRKGGLMCVSDNPCTMRDTG